MNRRAPPPTVALALALAFVAACGGPDEEVAPPSSTSERGLLTLSEAQRTRAGVDVRELTAAERAVPVSVPADLDPPDTARAMIGSIVEGRIEAVRVLPGDEVRAGDVLALIHSHEMMDARRDLTAARARLEYAARALARSEQLVAAGAVSREEVERRGAERAAAQAEVARAEEMVSHLDPSSEGDVTVRAPRDGVVLDVYVEPSMAVVPGDPVVEVGALTPLWATAHLPEEHAARLRPGADARVTMHAFAGDTLAGRLVRVGSRVDRRTRTVEVRVEVLDPPAGARPGMFARVDLLEAERRTGVEVPADAVQQVDGGAVVFVEEGPGRYRTVAVEVHPLGDDRLLVVGLPDPVRVVVAGAPFLKAAAEQGGVGEGEG
jgi:cobalt-zinc-cadmium efflux system membrane fusion protein